MPVAVHQSSLHQWHRGTQKTAGNDAGLVEWEWEKCCGIYHTSRQKKNVKRLLSRFENDFIIWIHKKDSKYQTWFLPYY
jgi:hypothetical protein